MQTIAQHIADFTGHGTKFRPKATHVIRRPLTPFYHFGGLTSLNGQRKPSSKPNRVLRTLAKLRRK